MPNNNLENRLWEAADQLRANSSLTAQEYSRPVLGLIFLKYADHRYSEAQKELEAKNTSGRRSIGKLDYQAKGVMYLTDKARYSYLTQLPEGADIGRSINEAMDAIENENEDLKGVLPRNLPSRYTSAPSAGIEFITSEKELAITSFRDEKTFTVSLSTCFSEIAFRSE